MPRTVTAIVTLGQECLGRTDPFPVDIPWWADVKPVVDHLRTTLGTPVHVLRLMDVTGGDGARYGHVTYHVEARGRPTRDEPPGRHRTPSTSSSPGPNTTCPAHLPARSSSTAPGTSPPCSASPPPTARSG